MSTVYASVNTPGPPGPAGRSALWLTGSAAPVVAQGLDGDMFLHTVTADVYGPKAGTWGPIVANIRGNAGVAGPPGYTALFVVAAGVPSPAQGNNGDMYLNSTTSDLYGPKAGGVWGPIVANIKGATGATGPPGVASVPKGAWVVGTTYTQGDLVTDANILYVSLQSGNVGHTPLSSPTWWQPATSGGGGSQWITTGNDIYYNLGRVGIGLTAPLNQFQVRVAANQNLGIRAVNGICSIGCFNDAGNGWAAMNLDASSFYFSTGPVGIGVASPGGPLHVHAPSGANICFITSTTGQNTFLEIGVAGSTIEITGLANGDLLLGHYALVSGVLQSIRAGAVANTLVMKGGLVGFGTPNPTNSVEIYGSNNPGLAFTNSTNPTVTMNWYIDNVGVLRCSKQGVANFMGIDSTGHVLIGLGASTGPYLLEINGAIKANAYIGIGQGAPTQYSSVAGTITGAINGENPVFTLSSVPTQSLVLYLDGARLINGVQFSWSAGSATITFIGVYLPQPGAMLSAEGW